MQHVLNFFRIFNLHLIFLILTLHPQPKDNLFDWKAHHLITVHLLSVLTFGQKIFCQLAWFNVWLSWFIKVNRVSADRRFNCKDTDWENDLGNLTLPDVSRRLWDLWDCAVALLTSSLKPTGNLLSLVNCSLKCGQINSSSCINIPGFVSERLIIRKLVKIVKFFQKFLHFFRTFSNEWWL